MQNSSNTPQIDFNQYKSPVTNPSARELNKIKKEQFFIKVFTFGCLGLILGGMGFAVWYIYINGNDIGKMVQNFTSGPTGTPLPQNEKPKLYDNVEFSKDINRVLPDGVDDHRRPEYDLLLLVLNKSIDKNWSGKFDTKLDFTAKDLDQTKLTDILEAEKVYQKTLIISDEYVKGQLNESAASINSKLQEYRNQYVKNINGNLVNEKYINEIETYVLPAVDGRIKYSSNGESYVGALNKVDYSRVEININQNDIYTNYIMLKSTAYGTKLSQEELLNQAVKLSLYEKMGYVVSQAFVNSYVEKEVKSNGEKDMWLQADVDFMKVSEKFFWPWKKNKEIFDSRLSYGLAVRVYIEENKMTEIERNDFMDHYIDRDNLNYNKIQVIGQQLNNYYSSNLLQNFDEYAKFIDTELTSTIDKESQEIFKGVLSRWNAISRLLGKQNPMSDNDMKFLLN